jgi:hypothetical protein
VLLHVTCAFTEVQAQKRLALLVEAIEHGTNNTTQQWSHKSPMSAHHRGSSSSVKVAAFIFVIPLPLRQHALH